MFVKLKKSLKLPDMFQQAEDGSCRHMRMVDRNELQEIEPYLADDLAGGIWTEVDSSMNPYKLCYAFVEEGKKLGLQVYDYHAVQNVRWMTKGRVESVVTDRGTF